MSSFFLFLFCFYYTPKKVSFLFSQFPLSQFKIRAGSLVPESDGWAFTQKVGGWKSVSLLKQPPGVSRAVLYYRKDQAVQVLLCLEPRSKTNLFGLEFLGNHGVTCLLHLLEWFIQFTKKTIKKNKTKSSVKDTVGFLSKHPFRLSNLNSTQRPERLNSLFTTWPYC